MSIALRVISSTSSISAQTSKPVVLRLHGSGRDTATRILAEAGFTNHETLEDAVVEAVAQTREPVP